MCAMYMPGGLGIQNRVMGLWELESQIVVSPHGCAGNRVQVLIRSTRCS